MSGTGPQSQPAMLKIDFNTTLGALYIGAIISTGRAICSLLPVP